MCKPLYYLVWIDGIPHRFETRKGARLFVAAQKLMGKQPIMKAIGF